jgi:TrpR-related protein YerC/YecD
MIDDLFQAMLLIKDQEDCYRFFEDLCTVGELKAMAQRWRVVKMLTDNSTYADIIVETGVSTATISRVKKCLYYGADGYRNILERYNEMGGKGR